MLPETLLPPSWPPPLAQRQVRAGSLVSTPGSPGCRAPAGRGEAEFETVLVLTLLIFLKKSLEKLYNEATQNKTIKHFI